MCYLGYYRQTTQSNNNETQFGNEMCGCIFMWPDLYSCSGPMFLSSLSELFLDVAIRPSLLTAFASLTLYFQLSLNEATPSILVILCSDVTLSLPKLPISIWIFMHLTQSCILRILHGIPQFLKCNHWNEMFCEKDPFWAWCTSIKIQKTHVSKYSDGKKITPISDHIWAEFPPS